VSFSNFDLANLVNKSIGVASPFDYHFTMEGIIRSWIAVGFLPMTGRATEDPKVRHELGEGGTPPAVAKRLAGVQNCSKDFDGDGIQWDNVGLCIALTSILAEIAQELTMTHPIKLEPSPTPPKYTSIKHQN
jgi:hypothetical protein